MTGIHRARVSLSVCLFLILFTAASRLPADGPAPQWIWAGGEARPNETVYLRRLFHLEEAGGAIARASLTAAGDNRMTVFLNGERVLRSDSWSDPARSDVTKRLRPGRNLLTAVVRNEDGPGGFVARLEIERKGEGKGKDASRVAIVTDRTWLAIDREVAGWQEPGFGAESWVAATEIAPAGGGAWAEQVTAASFDAAAAPARPQATPAESIVRLPGFRVELLHSVPKEEQGSWINLTVDSKGRLITSDQYGPLYRVTPPPIGGAPEETRVERIDLDLGGAHGLLWAFDSLYVVRGDAGDQGLYRARDTDGDDRLDEVRLLRRLKGGGEHGPHAIVVGPGGMDLYVCAGNHTDLPDPEKSLLPRVWGEDLLLPRMWDANGHARGRLAPGGWICRIDPDGKVWELVSAGYRNEFDIVFNKDGDLFTFDADMEWDIGTPWYRPTRVNHATSGSEFGWRSGTGKWPEYYPDSLGSVVDIGPGSPTGIVFGYGADFPPRYQEALYICDWSYGKMYAVHLEPDGSSYKGVAEQFLAASPLPLTDVVVNPHDRAMYFAIGGRRTQSGLYRVTYEGPRDGEPVAAVDPEAKQLREARRSLEKFHGREDSGAVAAAWPYLGHADRAIRYAARVAIEHQPVIEWQGRAIAETRPRALIEAAIALARHGDRSLQRPLLEALGRIAWQELSEMEKLALLRAVSLTFIRMGKPDGDIADEAAVRLADVYPSPTEPLNREIGALLVYLQSGGAARKTLDLLAVAPTQEEQIHYVLCLRNLEKGWTLESRKRYFEWFQSGHAFQGGHSFNGFLRNIKSEAVAKLSAEEKEALAPVLAERQAVSLAEHLPQPAGPGKKWTVDELVPILGERLRERSFENGKRMFAAARCFLCHRFDGQGGSAGPDLTGIAGRFNHRDLLEAVIAPSKTVSDQYRATVFVLKNGSVVTGRIINMGGDGLTVNTDMTAPDRNTGIRVQQILATSPSEVSIMPEDLLDPLNEEEVLDLMAYLLSRGDRHHAMFQKDT